MEELKRKRSDGGCMVIQNRMVQEDAMPIVLIPVKFLLI